MAERELKWPFGDTDGGPLSRPLIVDLENVLVVMVATDVEGEAVMDALREAGFTDAYLRFYRSEQILDFDEAFRSRRGLKERAVGALVDDADSMSKYVTYAREGCSAIWVLVEDRDDANRVIRHLADYALVYVWFHGSRGLETIQVR